MRHFRSAFGSELAEQFDRTKSLIRPSQASQARARISTACVLRHFHDAKKASLFAKTATVLPWYHYYKRRSLGNNGDKWYDVYVVRYRDDNKTQRLILEDPHLQQGLSCKKAKRASQSQRDFPFFSHQRPLWDG